MGLNMEIIWTRDLESKSYAEGLRLRKEVFVKEQKVPAEEEVDEFEKDCYHLSIYDGEEAAATGRILPKSGEKVKFGRVAVAKEKRGTGLGKLVMEEMEKKTLELGYKKIILGGQLSAVPFYEKLGYTPYGDIFLDGGIEHRMMKKDLREE